MRNDLSCRKQWMAQIWPTPPGRVTLNSRGSDPRNNADQSYLLLFFFLTFETLRLKTAKTWKVAAAYERTIKEKSICVSADGSLVNDCTHVHR